MIILEHNNGVLQNTLAQRFSAEKPELVDISLVDFDGAAYHMHTPEVPTTLVLSTRLRGYKELLQYGAKELLEEEFKGWIVPAEHGWDMTLKLPLDSLSDQQKDELTKKVGNLKRTAMSAPFLRAFKEHDRLVNDKSYKVDQTLMTVHYRPEETVWIQTQQDRVTVIFSTLFREETDRVFGKVFLQEFTDARKQLTLQNAPQVLHSKEPPLEIRHLPDLTISDNVSYVTFVLFPRHFAQGPPREMTLNQIELFRDYLHYHIKCCKAYMHSRLRRRVAEFLKVLNRAKPENVMSEKKLASGRTFVRRA